jgi:hypothetical protein
MGRTASIGDGVAGGDDDRREAATTAGTGVLASDA